MKKLLVLVTSSILLISTSLYAQTASDSQRRIGALVDMLSASQLEQLRNYDATHLAIAKKNQAKLIQDNQLFLSVMTSAQVNEKELNRVLNIVAQDKIVIMRGQTLAMNYLYNLLDDSKKPQAKKLLEAELNTTVHLSISQYEALLNKNSNS